MKVGRKPLDGIGSKNCIINTRLDEIRQADKLSKKYEVAKSYIFRLGVHYFTTELSKGRKPAEVLAELNNVY